MEKTRRIGTVSQITGLSIRTLRYYDERGLAGPSHRGDGGHRLYTDDDLERLYRVCVLRRLGAGLGDTAQALEQDTDVVDVVDTQLLDIDARLAELSRLRDRVSAVRADMHRGGSVDHRRLLDLLDGTDQPDSDLLRRITLCVYDDIGAAHEFLTRIFGLGAGQLSRDDRGVVQHGEVYAGDGVIWLHPPRPEVGLVSPRKHGEATHCMAVMVDDVDAHHERVRASGATVVAPPVDQPYGYREYSARDGEGLMWSFMQPLDDEPATD